MQRSHQFFHLCIHIYLTNKMIIKSKPTLTYLLVTYSGTAPKLIHIAILCILQNLLPYTNEYDIDKYLVVKNFGKSMNVNHQ